MSHDSHFFAFKIFTEIHPVRSIHNISTLTLLKLPSQTNLASNGMSSHHNRQKLGEVPVSVVILYVYMAIRRSDRSLESFKIFPYIAWTLVIGFAFFVYKINLMVEKITTDIETQSELTQAQDDAFVSKIKSSHASTTRIK